MSALQLQFQRLDSAATLPTQGHTGDLGWDLYALSAQTVHPGSLTRIGTGIAVGFPAGVGGFVKDRSSMALRGLHTLAGVIDPGYRGEVMVVAVNLGEQPISIRAGERFAQLVLVRTVASQAVEVQTLEETSRGAGGFGSTGR